MGFPSLSLSSPDPNKLIILLHKYTVLKYLLKISSYVVQGLPALTSFGSFKVQIHGPQEPAVLKISPGRENTCFTEHSDNDARGSFLSLYSAKGADRVTMQFPSQFRMAGKLSSA